MSYVYKCLIVPLEIQPISQNLCAQLAGQSGENMFTTGLSATGAAPATHFISAGMIDKQFAYVMSNSAIMHQSCINAGINVTLEQCQDILDAADISEDEPFIALDRIGLKLIQDELN